MTFARIVSLLLLSGCTQWREDVVINGMAMQKIVTPLAHQFCVAVTDKANAIACNVRFTDRCVIIVPEDSPELIGHEAIHCMGYSHP